MALLSRVYTNSKISGEILVPRSEAMIHRYMILNALSGNQKRIEHDNRSRDVLVTGRCLQTLDIGNTSPILGGNFVYRLECEASDLTYKLLLPVVSALGKSCIYATRGNVNFEYMDSFYKVLRTHGVKREVLRPDLVKVTGQMTAGTFILPGETDGQALSGLLMALPLLGEKSKVLVEKKPQSEMYVDLTISMMKEAGVEVTVEKGQMGLACTYTVAGGQKYDFNKNAENKTGKLNIERDWSLAAYWLCAGAISGSSVTCMQMNVDSLQGDVRILNILRLFGCDVTARPCADNEYLSDVTVAAGALKGINIDAEDIPDLLIPTVLLACASQGVSIIRNAQNLKISEKRVQNIIETLTEIGAQITMVPDGLLVIGSGGELLEGGRAKDRKDTNTVIMAALCSCICKKLIIEHCDIVERVYPQFFEELDRLRK